MGWPDLVAIFLGLVVVWLLLIAVLWALRPRSMRAGELMRVVPDIARLVRDLVTDPRVPVRTRLALVGLLAWLVSPIDLVPEFLPVVGPIDDVIVAVLVLRYVRRTVGEDELRRRWRGTDDGFDLVRRLL
jgi:uncharacterized membrane protein YkvA (DUF1232 family)